MKTSPRLSRRQWLATTTAWAAGSALPQLAHATPHDKPLRVILPRSAGSGADGAIRAIGPSVG